MRVFTLLLCSMFVWLNSVSAQQIKGDFDLPWIEDVKGNGALPGQYLRPGIQPVGWEASNVHQKVLMVKEEVLVTQDANRTGGDGFSVKMENKYVGAMGIGSNAPAYITLGTPWVYAVMALEQCTGGTLGGVEYIERPDSLVGYYKRTIGSEGNEPALLLAYLWTGSTTSTVSINPDGALSSTLTTQVVDQSSCIMGKEEPDSGDAVLIGKAEYNIETELNEWTRITIPFEYYKDVAPEKMNIILSSANYWDRSIIKNGNILWADDVRLISNAKLQSLTIDGEALTGFNEDIFSYQLPYADRNKEVKASAWGEEANVAIKTEDKTGEHIKTITVTCDKTNGKKSYVYTVSFKGEKTTISLPTEAPSFTYGDKITGFGFTSNSKADFTYTSTNERVIAIDKATHECTIVGVGTTDIVACQAGNDSHASAESLPLTITVDSALLTISLKEGAWVERGVTANATNMKSEMCSYEFVYTGLVNGEKAEEILTSPVNLQVYADKEPEVVGGKRQATFSGAKARNYKIAYDYSQSFTITKTTLNVYVTYNNVRFNSDYEDRKYHEVGTAFGKEADEFVLSYFNLKYNETEEEVLGELMPAVTCGVTKESALGSKHAVTLTFPDKEPKNYKWGSKLPDDAVLVVKKGVEIKADAITNKTYGDEKFTWNATAEKADNKESVTVSFVSKTTAIASIVAKTGDVTIKKAGTAFLSVYTAETEEYAPAEVIVSFDIAKVPLTITVQDTTRNEGEENPEFRLVYSGFKYKDNEKTSGLFITEPTIQCAADKNSAPGTYDVELVGGEAASYYLIPVKGVLTVKKGTAIEESATTHIRLFTRDGIVYIKNNITAEKIYIYDTQGRLISTHQGTDITINNLTKGNLYIIKIGDFLQKVLL